MHKRVCKPVQIFPEKTPYHSALLSLSQYNQPVSSSGQSPCRRGRFVRGSGGFKRR